MFDADSLEKKFENELGRDWTDQQLIDWIQERAPGRQVGTIGQRIVNGGPNYLKPCLMNDKVLSDLEELTAFDPEHLPIELELVRKLASVFPNAKQIACFDTAFHHSLPSESRLLPIPRRYEADGIRRYGFHGLSYSFLMSELERLTGDQARQGRVILAHLGNGASLAAVKNAQPIDTSMSLTPASGMAMSTRSGDLDPGLALYLQKTKGLGLEEFTQMINLKSGLLGISETSSDMKTLLEMEREDSRAAEAVAFFCYQAKKLIGSYTAALGGLDTLVFSGGIGEKSSIIRERICNGLEFLGIEIDANRNASNAEIISSDMSRVKARVIHTDEAVTIAREVAKLLKESS